MALSPEQQGNISIDASYRLDLSYLQGAMRSYAGNLIDQWEHSPMFAWTARHCTAPCCIGTAGLLSTIKCVTAAELIVRESWYQYSGAT